MAGMVLPCNKRKKKADDSSWMLKCFPVFQYIHIRMYYIDISIADNRDSTHSPQGLYMLLILGNKKLFSTLHKIQGWGGGGLRVRVMGPNQRFVLPSSSSSSRWDVSSALMLRPMSVLPRRFLCID